MLNTVVTTRREETKTEKEKATGNDDEPTGLTVKPVLMLLLMGSVLMVGIQHNQWKRG